jgi:hypothetical protein
MAPISTLHVPHGDGHLVESVRLPALANMLWCGMLRTHGQM